MRTKSVTAFVLFACLFFLLPLHVAAADPLILPASLSVIEQEAFCGDQKISNVTLPGNLRRIESRAFAGTSVEWIYLPSSLTYIAPDAFDKGVVFGADDGTYASTWIRENSEFGIAEEMYIPRFALFEDRYLPDYDMTVGHYQAAFIGSIPDYANLKQFMDGEPSWSVHVVSGDAEMAFHDWGSGGWLEVIRYPQTASRAVYCISCSWDGQTCEEYRTLDFVPAEELPIGADIPGQLYLQTNTATRLAFHPLYAGNPFSENLHAEFFPDDESDWIFETDGNRVTITPLRTGIFTVRLAVSDSNIRLMRETVFIVEENGASSDLAPRFTEDPVTLRELAAVPADAAPGIRCDDWVAEYSIENAETLTNAYGEEPIWSLELLSGEELGAYLFPKENGCLSLMLGRSPDTAGDSVYRLTCQWGPAFCSLDVTLRCAAYPSCPTGVSIERYYVMRPGDTLQLHADFSPAGWAAPNENMRDFGLWSMDESEINIRTEGTDAFIEAANTGIFELGGLLRSNGLVSDIRTTVIVLDETCPILAVPAATNRYNLYLFSGQDGQADMPVTVRAYSEPDCSEQFSAVTAVPENHCVSMETDAGIRFWFTGEAGGAVIGPVTAEPLPALDAPESCAATVDGENQIHLTWTDVEGAAGYRVYWRYAQEDGEEYLRWTPDTPWQNAVSGFDSLSLTGPVSIWVCAEGEYGPGRRAQVTADWLPDDLELQRAISFGFGSNGNLERVVTFGEFAEMLNRVLLNAGAAPRENWNVFYENACASAQPMSRREGMVAVYLASESLGEHFYEYNNLNEGIAIYNEIASVDSWGFWDEMNQGDYSLFANVWSSTLNGEDSYINAGYFYSMRRTSMSGCTIFDYDRTNKTMRPADAFTYREALLAAIRLRDSYMEEKPRPQTAADQQIQQTADEMREAILNSQTAVTVTGTRYYVSNAGNDSSSGKSTSTAWATLAKVNSANLQPGDAVFFKRGGVWRGALTLKPGVIYSAYGTGDKPKILGSPESGVGSSKWQKLSGTSNIWVFYKPMMECGDFVVDGSMTVFDKAPVWWAGDRHVQLNSGDSHDTLMAKQAFNPAANLKNHEYFIDINWSGISSVYPIAVFNDVNRTGTLYVRCDEGNPGALWSSFEFCCDPNHGNVIDARGAHGAVLDNLCVLYGGHAMEFYGTGCTVQNCEVGYIGAMTHTFYDNFTSYSGDGINHGTGMIVQNNYVHDVFNGGIAPGELSYNPSPDYAYTVEIQGNNLIRDNLLERTAGIVLINWETEVNTNHMYKNITIEGNYLMYSASAGDLTATKAEKVTGALVFSDNWEPLPCANENLVIRNNVFYCAKGALILSGMPKEYAAVYEGNTYAQYEGTPFAYWLFDDGTYKPIYTSGYTDLNAFVRDVLGDTTGVVLH